MSDDAERAAAPGASSRIKRNTACTSCRDAKVRCNPSLQPSQPCQRCAKLRIECVIDKSHKRVSRKSKLEELVQEIQTIKQTVEDRGAQVPVQQNVAYPQQQQQQQQVTTPFKEPDPPRLMPSPGVSRVTLSSNATVSTPATTLVSDSHIEPSLPRALASQPFSGEDIDYYFHKYFEHFHPYMPIVRHRDPNRCYDNGSILFWTIILIACRRYPRNDQVFPFLVDTVKRELFSVISNLPLSLSTINALILICTWVFPDVRFINDPTPLFSSVAMNAALMLGIHYGRGCIAEFSFGVFRTDFSDEEATYTWAGYNIVSQRVSACLGLPPVGGLFNQNIQNVIDGNTKFQVPSSFRVLLECQKFSNRICKIMTACLDESRGVSAQVVQQLEDEFDMIKGLICSERADVTNYGALLINVDDLDRFNALLVQQEIQAYYLLPSPGYDSDSLKRNILRAYATAQTVIREALELETKQGFLKHMPHFYFRSILTSICIVWKIVRSSYVDFLDRKPVERAASDSIAFCRRTVTVDGDLPYRLASLLESFWTLSQTVKWHEEPTSGFYHRLGAGVTFDCLKRWKEDMQKLPQPPLKNQQQQQQQQPQPQQQPSLSASTELGGSGDTQVPPPVVNLGAPNDALSGIVDWSFLDDFDWNFEPCSLLAPVS